MTRATFLIVALAASLGCARRPVHVVVPRECARITIHDFTKPCRPISDSSAVCDGVVIHMACVRYK